MCRILLEGANLAHLTREGRNCMTWEMQMGAHRLGMMEVEYFFLLCQNLQIIFSYGISRCCPELIPESSQPLFFPKGSFV